MEKKTSVLADGAVIPRVYEDEVQEQKRLDAINRLGTKWILHPANSVSKLKKPFNADTIFKKKLKEHHQRMVKKYKAA